MYLWHTHANTHAPIAATMCPSLLLLVCVKHSFFTLMLRNDPSHISKAQTPFRLHENHFFLIFRDSKIWFFLICETWWINLNLKLSWFLFPPKDVTKEISANTKEEKMSQNDHGVGVAVCKLFQIHTLCLWGPTLWPHVSLYGHGSTECAWMCVSLLASPKHSE